MLRSLDSARHPPTSLRAPGVLETAPGLARPDKPGYGPRYTFAQALRRDSHSSAKAVSWPKLSGSAVSWL